MRAACLGTLISATGCASTAPIRNAPSPDITTTSSLINAAIKRSEIPGAVLVVERDEQRVITKAFGHRAVKPQPVAMTVDTLFDLASLTKPIATATSVMILIDRGKIDPHAPVARYIPEFANNGKAKITVEQLLLHRGGLIPDNHLNDYKNGPAKAYENI